jgi:type I restriction enzyme, S subunit
LRKGDTIISTVRTYLKAIWYVAEDVHDLIASTGFAVLSPGKDVEPEYLSYVIQSVTVHLPLGDGKSLLSNDDSGYK